MEGSILSHLLLCLFVCFLGVATITGYLSLFFLCDPLYIMFVGERLHLLNSYWWHAASCMCVQIVTVGHRQR